MNKIPLNLQFSVERLKRYLEENSDDAIRLAIVHYQERKKLEIENEELTRQCQQLRLELQSPQSSKIVSLPRFLNSNGGVS